MDCELFDNCTGSITTRSLGHPIVLIREALQVRLPHNILRVQTGNKTSPLFSLTVNEHVTPLPLEGVVSNHIHLLGHTFMLCNNPLKVLF